MSKTGNQIRSEFIEFFKNKKHSFVKSAPVVPADDPTLLFTNAGMNQFKSIFLGEAREGLTRATNSQKCMRVSGKHNDLEEVGVDHHHHTFFEMLGNWSFGDYYKKEAIGWAWELITDVWKLPKDKLYATIFEDDNESEKIWKEQTDVLKSHIGRHGAKDNFWEMGDTGPCGPCSEIHLDCGEGVCVNEGVDGHVCAVNADGCGRYMEIWNLVFIQFNRNSDGSLTPLANKHVDTGMGFERIVRVVQGVKSNYDTDLFMPIIRAVEKMSCVKYDEGVDGTPFRVIADHIRSLVFAITDGAFPSNEGRGYVLRRILRRAYRFGNMLGFKEPFLYKLVSVVIEIMGDAYGELSQRQSHVEQIIENEEQRFGQTLEQGLEKLNAMIDKANVKDKKLKGDDVFMLYDTYGFPMDLTRLIASEKSISIDEDGFAKKMASQKKRARDAAKAGSSDGLTADGWTTFGEMKQTEFCGYNCLTETVFVSRHKVIKKNEAGLAIEILVAFDKTPFYPEMGGQLGDSGLIIFEDKTEAIVTDTIKWNDMTIHKLFSKKGLELSRFSEKNITAKVNEVNRKAIARNHSATHLLQAALVSQFGDHITQSGSRVGADALRFDFTHFKAMTKNEIFEVETRVNSWIFENHKISTEVKDTESAKKDGATALFGEKYGDTVRVVTMGDMSQELCGGTHATATGDIGLFHIISESSISAGVRRIEAVTATESLKLLNRRKSQVSKLCTKLKVSEDALDNRVDELLEKIKKLESELAKVSAGVAKDQALDIVKKSEESKTDLKWAVENVGSMDKKSFRSLTDSISDIIKQKSLNTTVIGIIGEVNTTVSISACSGSDTPNMGIHCGDIVKLAAAVTGGGGGGSPVRAQAGGKDLSKIAEAITKMSDMISEKEK